MSEKWDRRFIALAREVSQWSKDPSTKCGAVIVRPDRTIASIGFNGFPRGCDDAPELYADRAEKYQRVIHAEVNAVLSAREPLAGYTMYTYPGGLAPSCDRCATIVIQAGIRRIVHERVDNDFSRRWDPARSLELYNQAGVEVVALEELDPWRMINAGYRDQAVFSTNLSQEDAWRDGYRKRGRNREARIIRRGDSPGHGPAEITCEAVEEGPCRRLSTSIVNCVGLAFASLVDNRRKPK